MRRGLIRAAILATCFAAATGAGYLVSARLGSEALRQEAQEQLSMLLKGEVRVGRARLVIRGGVFIEGERVGVYPRSTVPHRPSLFVARVSAELDVFALLAGRFRVTTLVLDDALLKIERHADGSWTPPPLQTLYAGRRIALPDDLERNLDLVNAFEAVTRALLESPFVARRFEIRRSRVTFVDHTPTTRGRPAVELALHQLNARLLHPWLLRQADLKLGAVLVTGEGVTVPIRAEGRQRRGGELQLALSASQLPLGIFTSYLRTSDLEDRLSGATSGRLAFETRSLHHGTLVLQGMIEDFSASLATDRERPIGSWDPLARGRFVLERPLVQIDANLELHPGRVRLSEARLEASGLDLELLGTIERPLRQSSRMRLEATLGSLGIDEVVELGQSLPDEDRETLENLLERVESGRIDRIGASGVTRLAVWQRLFRGELERLPPSVVLTGDVSEVRVRSAGGGVLDQVGGSLELNGDHISFRNARALWNGEPLPTLDFSVDGISHLFLGPERLEEMDGRIGTLPGLDPLWEILRGDADQIPDPASRPRFEIKIDSLRHPVLRWPLREVELTLEPTESGAQLSITEGLWAGMPIHGEAVWLAPPRDVLTIDLTVAARDDESSDLPAPHLEAPKPRGRGKDESWATGRFEVDALSVGSLEIESLRGRFALQEASLYLSQIRASLQPSGKLVAHASVGLADPEHVDLAVKFSLVAGDVARLGEAIGLPPEFATGKVHLAGSYEGRLLPQTPILAAVDGTLKLDARDGEIRREVPLVLALAQASSGYNTLSDRDTIVYESVIAELQFRRGRIHTEDFQLEGPVRIYASGWLDAVAAEHAIEATVGVFLFRRAGQIIESVPAFKAIMPGSERGLIGAYYEVSGPMEDPVVDSMPYKSMAEDLPGVLAAPFKVFEALLSGDQKDEPPKGADPPEEGPDEAAK